MWQIQCNYSPLFNLTILHAAHYQNRIAYTTSAYRLDPSIDESYSSLAGTYIDAGMTTLLLKSCKQVYLKGEYENGFIGMLADILVRRGVL